MSAPVKANALADLRGLLRIAKAASVGVAGNTPRIERAEKAIQVFADLMAASEPFAASNGSEQIVQLEASSADVTRLRGVLARAGSAG